jgi:hypothetical protein
MQPLNLSVQFGLCCQARLADPIIADLWALKWEKDQHSGPSCLHIPMVGDDTAVNNIEPQFAVGRKHGRTSVGEDHNVLAVEGASRLS